MLSKVDVVPNPKEKQMMNRVSGLMEQNLGLRARSSYAENVIDFCYDGETALKARIRVTERWFRVEADGDVKEKTAAMLSKEGIAFVDHNIFLGVVTDFWPRVYAGCQFPSKISGRSDTMVKVADITDKLESKDNVAYYSVTFSGIALACVVALPENKYVDYVNLVSERVRFMLAAATAGGFAFSDFILKEAERLESAKEIERQKLVQTYLEQAARLKRLKANYKKQSAENGWAMTDPKKHSPDRFRYIVYAIKYDGEMQPFESDDVEKKYGKVYHTNPLSDPKLFLQREYISCSVIDQLHTATWDDGGLILDVPVENIRRALSSDLHTKVKADGKNDYARNLPDAAEVLRGSGLTIWNEVLISGVNEEKETKVKIAGGFVVDDVFTQKPQNEELGSAVSAFCEREKLPVVRLQELVRKQMATPPSDD